MKILVLRFTDTGDATIGALYLNGIFQCYTCEDEERDIKLKGETRVPNGIYNVTLRREGGFHNRYKEKFGRKHKGMLAISNKPDYWIVKDGMSFQYVLIHIGNTDDNTDGCLLVGNQATKSTVGSSTDAYRVLYPKIANAIVRGEKVTIEYRDIEEGK